MSIGNLIFEKTVRAPAKLNLRLKFVGRRRDGYHLLSMWNVLTSLYDLLEIKITSSQYPQVHLEIIGADELAGDVSGNLVYQAAREWLLRFQQNWCVHCRLLKNIPLGAGLGGGSSDAAAMLLTLTEVLGGVPKEELLELALKLGADLPFFIFGDEVNPYSNGAWVGGIGDQVVFFNVQGLTGRAGVIIMPWLSLSTKDMYSAVRDHFVLLSERVDNSVELPPECFDEMHGDFVNDFEEVLHQVSPDLANFMYDLRRRGVKLHLTGSGAAFFVLSEVDEDIRMLSSRVEHALDEGGWSNKVRCYPVIIGGGNPHGEDRKGCSNSRGG
jgi:4-diphosphocytidyl-2-C-methyl-D-erythritol kinase